MFENKDGTFFSFFFIRIKIALKILDMPDGVQELNYNLWTALSRRSCVGNIEKCFYNQTVQKNSGSFGDAKFWRMFDRTDAGACVALQTLPFGMDEEFETTNAELKRYATGPVFVNCKTLNYFACEALGKRPHYLLETVNNAQTVF